MKRLHAFFNTSHAVLFAAALLAIANPAWAHHSFTMFDMSKRITLTGTVTSFEVQHHQSRRKADAGDQSAEERPERRIPF